MEYTRSPMQPSLAAQASAEPAGSSGRIAGTSAMLAYSPSTTSPRGVQNLTVPFQQTQKDAGRTGSTETFRVVSVVFVGILYLVLLVVMLYATGTGRASLGMSVAPTAGSGWVVTKVTSIGLGSDREIRPGFVLVSVDGIPVSKLASIDLQRANLIELRPAGGGQSQMIDVRVRESGQGAQTWAYILLGVIFIAIGSPVYAKARQRGAAEAFYLFCAATAVALALAPATFLYYPWALSMMFVTLVVWATSFALFFFRFPVPVGSTPARHRLLTIVTFAAGLSILAAYTWVIATDAIEYTFVRVLAYFYLAACVASGLFILVRHWVAERTPEVRQQLVLLLGGTAFGVLPTLLLGVIPTLLFSQPIVPVEFTAMSLGIMPVSFAYAITQHQLLGIRSFVRRGFVYVVMGSSVLLAFSIGAAALKTLLPQGWQGDGFFGFGLLVFLIAISFGYLQRRVEHLVDRYIYHDAYDYKEELHHFSTQLAAEQNLTVLAEELVERTCRLMNLTCGVLLLAEKPDAQLLDRTEPLPIAGGDHSTVLLDETRPRADERYTRALAKSLAAGRRSGVKTQPALVPTQIASGQIVLQPFAQYGDYAAWMLAGLQAELARLGIILHGSDALPQLRSASEGAQYNQTRVLGAEHDGTSADQTHEESEAAYAIHSFLGVPLWTRSYFIGVLCLGGKRTGERFTRDDLSLLGTLGSQAALAIYNAQLYEAREEALLDTITALAHAIEAKDTYTINHCENITDRAVALAHAMGLPRQEAENIRLGSILHDVGKIGIPDAILNKPGRLTDEEYEVIKQHAQIGAKIVQSVGALQGVVPIVRHHQERFDGLGYPDGLSGDAIPIGARIISVVDAYGAMTEDRVYRKALGHTRAFEELRSCAGTQFDPVVVDTFIRLLSEQPDFAELGTEPVSV